MNSPLSSDDPKQKLTSAGKLRNIWFLLVGVALVGTYASLFIPAMAGQPQNAQSGLSALLWSSLFFYLWWRQRGRKGWQGALVGAVVGLAVVFLAAFMGGFLRHA